MYQIFSIICFRALDHLYLSHVYTDMWLVSRAICTVTCLFFCILGSVDFFFVLPLLCKLSHFSHSFPFFPVFLDHHLQGGWGAHQGGHRLHVVIVVLLLAVPFDPALDRFLQEGTGSEAQIFQWRLYLFCTLSRWQLWNLVYIMQGSRTSIEAWKVGLIIFSIT